MNLIMPNETEVNIPYTHSIWDIEPANLQPYGNNGGEDVPSGKHPFSGFAGREFSPGKKKHFLVKLRKQNEHVSIYWSLLIKRS